jgi:RNA polymerase sigma-70 factor (ECF subfamily)
MDKESITERLSRISTIWTVLQQAHQGTPDAAAAAQQVLIQRYGGAVRRYLLAALHDSHAADDLTQEFGLRLVRGDFHKVHPQRGRFRDYVKTVLFHLVSHYRKRRQPRMQSLPPDSPELVNLAAPRHDLDRAFQESWREELMARAWEALAETQPNWYAVLRLRATHPDWQSPQLAAQLTRQLGKPFTAEGFRQSLHRARDRFAELLLDEVGRSLERPTIEQVEQELRELNLLSYCQTALARDAQSR